MHLLPVKTKIDLLRQMKKRSENNRFITTLADLRNFGGKALKVDYCMYLSLPTTVVFFVKPASNL